MLEFNQPADSVIKQVTHSGFKVYVQYLPSDKLYLSIDFVSFWVFLKKMSLLMPREAGAFILKHAKNVSISKKGIDKLTKEVSKLY